MLEIKINDGHTMTREDQREYDVLKAAAKLVDKNHEDYKDYAHFCSNYAANRATYAKEYPKNDPFGKKTQSRYHKIYADNLRKFGVVDN